MTSYDFAAEARSRSATAAGYTRRAEKEARQADEAYRTARGWQRQARQLTANPRLIYQEYNPAQLEANARTWAHIGDTYLRASFWSTEQAAAYREMAARNRERVN